MKLVERLKALLPVSRKQYEADLAKAAEDKRKALQYQESRLAEKEREMTAALDKLMPQLSRIEWRPEGWGGFALQMHISDQMMRHVIDPTQKRMVAEAIGRQVMGEIMASKFIQDGVFNRC